MERDRRAGPQGDRRADVSIGHPNRKPAIKPAMEISGRIAVATAFIGLFVINLHTLPELGGTFQIAGLSTIILASVFAYIARPATWRLTPMEIIGIVMFLISLGVNMSGYAAYLDRNHLSLQTTLLLLPVVLACGTLARCLPIAQQLRMFAWCLGISAIFALIFNFGSFRGSLSGNGLLRYSPFNMHPNLTGLTYGLGLLLSLYLILDRRLKSRVAGWIFLPVQALSVVASGSRGATLGLVACVIIAGVARWNRLPKPVQRLFLIGLCLAALVIILRGPQLYDYLVGVFSLESKGRGIGSGGSGRLNQWQQFPKLIFSSPERMMFGTGLRSLIVPDPTVIADSAYLSTALQSGFPITVAIVAVLLITCWRLHMGQEGHGHHDLEKFVIFLILVYMTIAAIFIITLFSVGNAGSYIFLILLVVAWFLGGSRQPGDNRFAAPQNDNPTDPDCANSRSAAWRAARMERRTRNFASTPPRSPRQTPH